MKAGIRCFAAFAAALLMVSCHDAKFSVAVSGMDSGRLALKQLDGESLVLLDSVTVENGSFSYSMDVEEGSPRFVYIYSDKGKIASLVVAKGDEINVRTDLGGNCSAEGSEETALLMQIEKDYATFLRDFNSSEDVYAANKLYLSYMRDRIAYIGNNSSKLSTLTIFYQTLPGAGSIFPQPSEAIRFRAYLDSLKIYYPDSDYVPAFEKVVEAKENDMRIALLMDSADELGAPEINLPDPSSNYVKLSEVKSKVVMIYFWLAKDNRQKMLNNTMMKVVYEKYHDKGFEIYAVSLDEDKSEWARAVVNQKLDWVNVNDNRGLSSPYIYTYNLQSLPTLYFLLDGQVQESPGVDTVEELDKYLSGLLK